MKLKICEFIHNEVAMREFYFRNGDKCHRIVKGYPFMEILNKYKELGESGVDPHYLAIALGLDKSYSAPRQFVTDYKPSVIEVVFPKYGRTFRPLATFVTTRCGGDAYMAVDGSAKIIWGEDRND
jgi:hypothetical protein